MGLTMGNRDHSDDRLRAFRPRMGRTDRARDRVASSSLPIATLVRRGHGRLGANRAVKLPPTAGFGPRHNARRVVVKAHLQQLRSRGAQAAARHLRYIERDGVEKDGSPGVLYGSEGPVPREHFEQPRLGERHQFRFIVSPEDARDLDLIDYVRELMNRVERDLGRSIEWAAVNHHDTEHPHAHVIVRGVCREGRQLRMDRAYIARGLRWSAQELAIERLGPRLENEIRRTLEREVTQETSATATLISLEITAAWPSGIHLNKVTDYKRLVSTADSIGSKAAMRRTFRIVLGDLNRGEFRGKSRRVELIITSAMSALSVACTSSGPSTSLDSGSTSGNMDSSAAQDQYGASPEGGADAIFIADVVATDAASKIDTSVSDAGNSTSCSVYMGNCHAATGLPCCPGLTCVNQALCCVSPGLIGGGGCAFNTDCCSGYCQDSGSGGLNDYCCNIAGQACQYDTECCSSKCANHTCN